MKTLYRYFEMLTQTCVEHEKYKSHKNSKILKPDICLESANQTTAWRVKVETCEEIGSIQKLISHKDSKILKHNICLESVKQTTAWRVNAELRLESGSMEFKSYKKY